MNIRKKIYCLLVAVGLPMAGLQAQEIKVQGQGGKEEIFDLPEGMMDHEIDSLLKEWNTRNFVNATDATCEPSRENPTFPKETYMQRLSRLPNVIDMPYNDVVQQFIDQYSGRLRSSVSIMLGASNFYTPIFEEALESYQVPLELKYLPVIESALNPGATSRAGAVGLWQFMITTGKQYGLEVTSLVDERRDPIKSSFAAAHYLKDLYDIFGDWTLVVASYNCGPGNVNKAIKRAGGSKDFWQIYPYLPSETRGYVPAFIAANYIMTYYCEHNICPAKTNLPPSSDTIMVSRNISLARICAQCEIPLEELKSLNPQYRTLLVPGASKLCCLRMPSEAISTFLEMGDGMYEEAEGTTFMPDEPVKEVVVDNSKNSKTKKDNAQYYTIKNGDNLGAIARKYRTTVSKLQKLNGLRGTNIRAGQKLRVK